MEESTGPESSSKDIEFNQGHLTNMYARYLMRIGATAEGENQFRVQGDGYSSTLFSLNPDGTLNVLTQGPALPDPTEAEVDELKAKHDKLKAIQLPRWTMAEFFPTMDGEAYPAGLTGRHHYYKNKKGETGLVVQRIDPTPENGMDEKRCFSWICADGYKWVRQEYPDPRPLYGEYWARDKIMVHEGEKAVDAAVAASHPTSGHPWQQWLSQYAHITWRGGAIANSPNKADWSLLPKTAEVFLLPDNDSSGFRAMRAVARQLSHVETVIMASYAGTPLYTKNNPKMRGWDVADEPPFYDAGLLIRSANLSERTHVPELIISVNAKGESVEKVMFNLRPQFAQKVIKVLGTNEYVLRTGDCISQPMSSKDISLSCRPLLPEAAPISSMEDIFRSEDIIHVSRFGYNPRLTKTREGVWKNPPMLYSTDTDSVTALNRFEPSVAPTKEVRNYGQFKRATKRVYPFLKHVLPDPVERKTVLRWFCSLAVGDKPMWAVLMISKTHGTGKSTMVNLLSSLIGRRNSTEVTSALLDEKYNGWAEGKQLIACHELKENAGGWGWALAEKLKPIITEELIPVRRMNKDAYLTENVASILACSNHFDCLRMGEEDRRWYLPQVTEQKLDGRTAGAVRKLTRNAEAMAPLLWMVREYGFALRERKWILSAPEAPTSVQKRKAQDATRGLIKDLILEEWMGESDRHLILLRDIESLLEERKMKIPSAAKLRKEIEELGLIEITPPHHKQNVKDGRAIKLNIGGTTTVMRMYCEPQHMEELRKHKKNEGLNEWVFRRADMRSKRFSQYIIDEGSSAPVPADDVL